MSLTPSSHVSIPASTSAEPSPQHVHRPASCTKLLRKLGQVSQGYPFRQLSNELREAFFQIRGNVRGETCHVTSMKSGFFRGFIGYCLFGGITSWNAGRITCGRSCGHGSAQRMGVRCWLVLQCLCNCASCGASWLCRWMEMREGRRKRRSLKEGKCPAKIISKSQLLSLSIL